MSAHEGEGTAAALRARLRAQGVPEAAVDAAMANAERLAAAAAGLRADPLTPAGPVEISRSLAREADG